MKKRLKLDFLDGIRGICALYVALYHAYLFTGHGIDKEQYSQFTKVITYILSYGHYSVTVFIVLSGFCLTIPVATADEKKLKGGFFGYIGRRAYRILPPYFFALIFSLVLIASFPVLQTTHDTAWDSKIPVTISSVISHIFLIHNFSLDWVNKINGPMWSVATEWQIYFFFPLLIAIWRIANILVSVTIAMFVGLLPRLLLPMDWNLSWLHPWYLGLFAMGMATANVVFAVDYRWVKFRDKINWKFVSVLVGIVLLVVLTITHRWVKFSVMTYEMFVGAFICILLINFSLIEVESNKKPKLLSILNSKIAIFFGSFSYSIYLIHSPLLGLLNLSILKKDIGSDARLLIMIFIAVPISVAISYAFYLLVESRFLSKPFKNIDYKSKDASLSY